MSRLREEFAIVPRVAKAIAALVYAAFALLVGFIWLTPLVEKGELPLPAALFFLVSLVAVLPLALLVLLIGYVHADAQRRGMRHVVWTLLAIFIPNAVGIILYFILRAPLPVPCPSCGCPTPKAHAFCPKCGTAVSRFCSQCRQPVEAGWTHCARCGAPLAAAASA
jgi:hypothetical protein